MMLGAPLTLPALRIDMLEQYLVGVFHLFGYSWPRDKDGGGQLRRCPGCSTLRVALCGDDGRRHGVGHERNTRHAECPLCVKPAPAKVVRPFPLNEPGSQDGASSTSSAQRVANQPEKVGDAPWFRELTALLQEDGLD